MPKIELTNYKGREQEYVKHCLLEKYLSQWGYIVGRGWDSLAYVDGFAGPWGAQSAAFDDASFGIATRVINEVLDGLLKTHQRLIRGLCIFVEKKPNAFAKLDAFAKGRSTARVKAMALRGRFVENIPKIESQIATLGRNPFKFVFLDQKGWAATPMAKLQPFLSRRSCGFQYVSQALVMDPKKEKVRYHLIFASNSLRGIEVFKNAEMEAAETQDDVRHETEIRKTGQPELSLVTEDPKTRLARTMRSAYLGLMGKKVSDLLAAASGEVNYDTIFGEAMAFPLVTPDDLVAFLKQLEPAVTVLLEGKGRRRPSPGKGDRVRFTGERPIRT
jgi:hypothetical protein